MIILIVRKILKPILYAVGYCMIIPFAYLIPKANYVVLITRFGDFEGNLKYLYLYLTGLEDEKAKFVFLTDKKEVYEKIKDYGINVWFYPSFLVMLRLLRSRMVIVDGNEWTKQLKLFFLFNSKKIQVWHGTGLKVIGLLKPAVKNLSNFRKMFIKENTFYDVVVLSSEYQARIRAKAFRYGRLLLNGLPRNDIFFNHDLIISNNPGCDNEMIKQFLQFKIDGLKIVTYAPTWRKNDENLEHLQLDRLDDFACRNRIAFIVKLHSKYKVLLDFSGYDYIVEYDKYADAYPLLSITDLLITDYSSIYLDFLLIDRPIIFYPYDKRDYINGERELLLDYEEVTPGTICLNQNELENELYRQLIEGKDEYKTERDALRAKFFYYTDGKSSERLWCAIKHYILEPEEKLINAHLSMEESDLKITSEVKNKFD